MSSAWVEEDEREEKVDLHLWRKLLNYTLRYRKTSIAFCFVAAGMASCDLAFPILTRDLIDAIEADESSIDLWAYGWWYAGLTMGLCSCIWAFIACAGKIRTHVSHDIRSDAFVQLQELSFSFFDVRPVGWLMARLTADCQRLSQILAWGVMDLIWGTTLMAGITVTMLIYNWRLALVVLSVAPVMFMVSVYFRKRILRTSRLVRKSNSKLTAAYNEAITGVRTTKVFVREEASLSDFDSLAEEMQRHSVSNSVLAATYLPLVLTIGSVAIALAMARGGQQVLGGRLTVGEVVMFMSFAQLLFAPIQDLSAWFAELQMAQASAERVMRLVEAAPEIVDRPAAEDWAANRESSAITATPVGRIEFRDVRFQYRDGPTVIDGVNLVVEPGETVALVGATGGGKSTLVNLLCRFYEPTGGEIRIDGADYRDRPLQWLQSKLGIVLQQPHLFSGTIFENICYGKLDASRQEVETAAEVAGAADFIDALEHGYDTEVGEGGSQLSLGQKQLVSFARAILKEPELLVMDEATSSIDTETEQHIQAGLSRVLSGRTSFVIAHRLSTIRAADKILVIDRGQVREQGDHESLMRKRGRYYELYTEQSMRDFDA